jgi:transcriptional regulator with XRE-family HTH domain
MVRPMLTSAERARGQRLGAALRQARGERSMVDVAARAGVPVETLRKIETGRIPTPAFFTVVALAEAAGISLGHLAAAADGGEDSGQRAAPAAAGTSALSA